MKVGLALAVLLVGIVSAFFFRNEAPVDSEVPQLENAKQLDDRIAEKETTPYLTGVESDGVAPQANRADRAAVAQLSQKPLPEFQKPDWELPDFLKGPTNGDSKVDTKPAAAANVLPPPDPIRIDPQQQTDVAVRVPPHNNAWESGPSKSPSFVKKKGSVGSGEKPATSLQVTHRVEKGETLSGLAARYLGSSARFLDIYNANRDQLRSPNDLQVGMEIKIPVATAAATAQPQQPDRPSPIATPVKGTQSTPGPDATAPGPDATAPGGRFLPVKRHPFRAGSLDDRSSWLDDSLKPSRFLSQVPPPDLPKLDADAAGFAPTTKVVQRQTTSKSADTAGSTAAKMPAEPKTDLRKASLDDPIPVVD